MQVVAVTVVIIALAVLIGVSGAIACWFVIPQHIGLVGGFLLCLIIDTIDCDLGFVTDVLFVV